VWVRMKVTVDTTRLKQTKDTLINSEEKFRSIFENAVDGMFQATPQGKYLRVNPAYAGMLGFESPEEMIAEIDDIQSDLYVDPDDRNTIKLLYEQLGVVRNFETQLKRKDGQKIWISANARAVRDDRGIILYYEGTVKDITERKLAVDALRQSERRFSIAFHENPTPTIISSVANGRYVDVNRSFLNLLGYHREEVIGRTAMELGIWADPEERSKVIEKLQRERLLRDEPLSLRTKSGEVRHLLVSAQMIRQHGHDLILSLFQDITERKQSEERLRESEQRYRDFFQTSRDCVFISSLEGAWIDFNDAAIELFGYADRADLMRVKIEDLYVNPAQRTELLNRIQDVGFIKDFPVNLRKKDGTIIQALLTSVGHKDERNQLLQHQGTIKDVTEQRALEARLQRAHKMEALGTLAGGIAHDFNNILGIIVGFTEMALMTLPESSTAKRNLQRALEATRRAERLVKQIVSFTRPVPQTRQPLEMARIVRDSLRFLRSSLSATIAIRDHVACRGTVLGDASELQQLILNLCTNAGHAMQDQPGVLEVSLHEVTVATTQSLDSGELAPGRYVKLVVEDTGHGIDPSIRHRIFDPYFTTKPTASSSGLGLSTVHGVVMNYKGALRVESVPGQGTRFEIFLPTIEPSLKQGELDTERSVPGGSGTILFVDDEPSLAEVGKLMLERLGYQVLAVTDPLEALKIFAADPRRFDAVVTDMTMPQMTGVELSRKLMEQRRDIPIILCTGYSEHVDKERAEGLGIRGFMMKPCTLRAYGDMVHRILGGKKDDPTKPVSHA
jgi:PAS domain S-box-containing protein